MSSLLMLMLVFWTLETHASQWEYNFYRHIDETEVIYSEGDGTLDAYMQVSARIKSDNTVSVTAIRTNQQSFAKGTLFLLKDASDSFPQYDPDNIQASDSVDNIPSRTLISSHNLDDMPSQWSGNEQGGVMHMYLLYENETDYAYIGPISIQRTPRKASSNLIVNLSPSSAITDGAEWRISDGTLITRWYKSGEGLDEPLIAGDYTVEFKQLIHLGWRSRSDIQVTLAHDNTLTKTVYYFKDNKGCIQGITYPASVGGQWRVWLGAQGYSEWYHSGEIMPDIEPGQKGIQFKDILDWVTPNEITLEVQSNMTAMAQGLYCKEKPDPPEGVKTLSGLYTNKIVIIWTKALCDFNYEIFRGTTNDPTDSVNTKLLASDLTGDIYEDTSVSPGVYYYYWIRAYHIHGESELSAYAQGFVKLQTPTNVQATDCSANDSLKTRITFSTVPGATGYEIWRANVENPGLASYLGKTNDTYYDDTSGVYEKSYYYWVKAVNTKLNTKSEMTQHWVRGCKRMPAVTNVRASDGTDCTMVVVNFETIPDAERHNINYRLYNPNDSSEIDVKTQTRSSLDALVDYNSIAGKSQYYRVVAYNSHGSRISAPDSGWKQMCPVQNLRTINSDRPGTVHLRWSKVDDASGYIIKRGIIEDIQSAENIGNTMQLEYIDNSAGQEYHYWIKAFNEYTDSLSPESVQGSPKSCEYTLEPSTIRMDASGGDGSVLVKTNFDTCEWRVTNTLHWITFSQSNGIGTADATFTMKSSDLARTGSVMIGGDGSSPYNINQKQLLFEQYVDYTLRIDTLGNGKVKINGVLENLPYEQVFDSGEQIDIQAIPMASNLTCIYNSFDHWAGTENSSPDMSVVMNNDLNLTAQFIQMASLNISIEDDGYVKINNNAIDQNAQFDYTLNTQVTLQAIPKDDSSFLGWQINNASSLSTSVQLDLTLTQCYDIKAVFDSGWEMDIQSTRGDYSPSVTIGVKAIREYTDMPPLPPGYETAISINRYHENDWESSAAVDIRQKPENDLFFDYQYWGLSINPHGPFGPPYETTAVISWDPDQIDNDYKCQVLSGYDINGNVLISDMRETKQFDVTGVNGFQNFTVRCRKIPERPTMMLYAQNIEIVTQAAVLLDTGLENQTVEAVPLPPEYAGFLSLISVPDWEIPLSLQVFKQGKDFYNWVIAVNPHGNVGGPQEATATLRWDLSHFNEGDIGFWKLIKGYDPDGEIVVQDMTKVQEMTVSGVDNVQYFVVHWSRFWEFELNAGWNLISLPLESNNMSVNSLFEDASSVYAFVNGGYELVDHIEACKGYWVKMPEAKTYQFYGNPVSSCDRELSDGWHLIGSMFYESTPTSLPENKITSIFKYENGGYLLVDKLLPGYGYWLKLSDAAMLKYSSSAQ